MNKVTKNIFKFFAVSIFLVVLTILGVQFATTSHTFIAIDDFSITVNEDTPTIETITNRIYPIKHAAQFSEKAVNFDITLSAVSGNAQIAHVPYTISGNDTAQLNITAPSAGSQTFTLTVTDKSITTLTASKTIPLTITATDSEAFFTQTTKSFQFAEDTATQTFDLATLIDNDGETETLDFAVLQNQNEVTCAVNGTTLSYTPKQHFNGEGIAAAKCVFTMSDANAIILASQRTSIANPKTLTVDFNVTPVNDPVTYVATNPSTYTFAENTNLSLELTKLFTDVDTADFQPQTLTFTGTVSPTVDATVTINAAQKTAVIAPRAGFNGNLTLTFNASDGAGSTVTSPALTLAVTEVNNDAPVFSATFFGAPITVAENNNTSFDLDDVVDDADTADASLSFDILGTSANLNVALNATTHVLTITPKLNFNGNDAFVVRASDGVSTTVQNVRVSVTGTNQAPTIPVLTSPANGTSITTPNSKVNLVWNASTDGENDPITYNVTIFETQNQATTQRTLSTSAATLADLDVRSNVQYSWLVVARDSAGGTATSTTFSFTPSTNLAPTITSFSPDVASKTIKEGESIAFTYTATDPSNDTLTQTWSVNGQARATTQNFSFTTDFNSAGNYNISLAITDGANTLTRTVAVTVTDVTPTLGLSARDPTNSDLLLAPSGSKTFSLTLDNPTTVPVSYQWLLNGAQVATTPSYTFTAPAKAGTANNVKVIVTSSALPNNAAVNFEWVVQTIDKPSSVSGKIKGTVTQFTPAQLASATGVTIENPGLARIDFGSQSIDLRTVIDLDNFVKVDANVVAIDSAQLPVLNKPATITLHGVQYTDAPQIFFTQSFTSDRTKMSTKCLACTILNATAAPTTSGTVTFRVPSFSSYTVGNAAGATSTTPSASSKLAMTRVKVAGDTLTIGANASDVAEDNIKPGDKVQIEVRLENSFSASSDPEIEGIEVEATIKDIDDGDDLDLDVEDFDLKPGRSKTVTMDFTVPDEVKHNAKYEIVLTADGRDKDGKRYTANSRGFLRIEKEKHEVHIKDITLTPSLVSCSRSVTINVDVVNRGRENERNARLKISSDSLGISQEDTLDLDENPSDSDFTAERTHSFAIAAAAKGEHTVTVQTFYDRETLSETLTKTLTVAECQDQTVRPRAGAGGTVEVVTPPTTTDTAPVTVASAKIYGMSDEELLLIVVLGGVVVILILLIAILLMMPKKRKKKAQKRMMLAEKKSRKQQQGKEKTTAQEKKLAEFKDELKK